MAQDPQSPLYKVQVWIHRRRSDAMEVLLLKLVDERGGFWQPVTGGVDPGEKIEIAAMREAREETALSFIGAPFSLNYRFTFHSPRHGRDCEEHVFGLEAVATEREVVLDPREHTEYRWMAPDQAMAMLRHPSNAEGLRRLLARGR